MKVAPEVRDAKRTIRLKPKKENSKYSLAPGPIIPPNSSDLLWLLRDRA